MERKKIADREAELESKIMNKVNETLEKERQLYGVMRMSDHEVNEMVENSVGYLLQNVRLLLISLLAFRSNIYFAKSGRRHRRQSEVPEPVVSLPRKASIGSWS